MPVSFLHLSCKRIRKQSGLVKLTRPRSAYLGRYTLVSSVLEQIVDYIFVALLRGHVQGSEGILSKD